MQGVGKGKMPGLLCPAASRTWPGERLISWLRLNPRAMAGGGASAMSVPADASVPADGVMVRRPRKGCRDHSLLEDLQQCLPSVLVNAACPQ